jgi:hypothetical protein
MGGGPNSAQLEFTLTPPRNTEDPVTGVTKVRLRLDQNWSRIVRGEAQSVGIARPRLATGPATLSRECVVRAAAAAAHARGPRQIA